MVKHFSFVLLFVLTLHGTTLHLAMSSNPSRINPLLATDSASATISDLLFNGLVKYDKQGKHLIGDLARSYYFENNTTLHFILRRNVRWHDGAAFTANDVKFTFELLFDKRLFSPYTQTFRAVASVEVIDDYHLVVHYKRPYFKAVEIWSMGMVPKHILENEKSIMSSTFNTHPIGTGPYTLSSMVLSQAIRLDAFDDYFEHRPYIDTIEYRVVADATTRFLLLKTHKLDVDSLEPMQLQRQVDKAFFTHYNKAELLAHAYTYVGFNLRRKPFSDKRVRQALNLAINRQEIIDLIFLGHAIPCSGPFLPGSASFNAQVSPALYDPKRAKALLEEAGFTKEHPLRFELATSNSSTIRPLVAEIIQQQLARIGVEVKLKILEWQAFLNTVVFPRQFDTVLLGWSLSLQPDPYLLWHSDSDAAGKFNFIGYHNKVVDQQIIAMQQAVNPADIAKYGQKIFANIVADVPYIFLYIPNDIRIYNRQLQPIEPTINGIMHNLIEWKKGE